MILFVHPSFMMIEKFYVVPGLIIKKEMLISPDEAVKSLTELIVFPLLGHRAESDEYGIPPFPA